MQRTSALLEGQSLLAWGEAAEAGVDGSTQCSDAPPAALLAPVLVDPHSHLLDPFSGQAETLESLAAEAAAAGYGSVALLATGQRMARPARSAAIALATAAAVAALGGD